MSALTMGDYSLERGRGRWVGTCYHCGHKAAPKHYVGHAEQAIRQHIHDVHRPSHLRRDFCETWGAA